MENEEILVKWYYRPWVVILILIFFLGPLGLPLVWKSPKFSTPMKWLMTVIMIVYSWYLVIATAEMIEKMAPVYQALVDALR